MNLYVAVVVVFIIIIFIKTRMQRADNELISLCTRILEILFSYLFIII